MTETPKDFHHESFGAISVSHVSGDAKLFMSPHRHQNYVTVRITRAMVRRDLSNDSMFGHGEIIAEVDMSESQWAHFISTPNSGSGAPCTLDHVRTGDLKKMERPPQHSATRETFSKELRDRAVVILKGVRSALGAMDKLLAGGPVNKAALKAVRHDLSMSMANDIDGGLGFTMKQSEEWLDKMVLSAKTEVEAAAMNGLRGIALEAVANAISPEAKAALLKGITTAADDAAEGARGIAAPPLDGGDES